MSKRRWLIVGGVVALVLGALLAWWLWPRNVAVETTQTDVAIEEIATTVNKLAETVDSLAASSRKGVTVIRETITAEVQALPVDAVAADLNRELARWRGLDVRAGGVDGD
jgi:predicted negative regulator of RcsB-dependent stress response